MSTLSIILALTLVLPLTTAIHGQTTTEEVQQAQDENRPEVMIAESWSRLQDSITGTKNTDTRIAAITALSQLGGNQRAEELVRQTLHDSDIDVRLSAIVAAGEMAKDKGSHGDLPGALREQLNDADPKVAFTAASTLWKLDDPSGEDILVAVAQGERSADYSALKSSRLTASRTLHSPSALARIAAEQGLSMLVPPVGIGMGAYGYLKGSPGGASPQITAITELSKQRTQPIKNALIAGTKAKDPGARLAAAEALGGFSSQDTTDALRALFADPREGVRLTARAAYIRVASNPQAAKPVISHHVKQRG